MDEIEFREILAQGHELSGIEYKSPGSRTDKAFAAKVVRACLGMANHKGGGRIFLGIAEKAQLPPEPTGISDADALTWNYDELSATLSEYADPSISFEIEVFPYDGNKFVNITVAEFQEIPIICKKDYQEQSPKKEMVLRKGACYVRTRRKPETTEIPSQEDMRDLLI